MILSGTFLLNLEQVIKVMRHIIRKQVLELKLADSQDMFMLQQKISQYYYKHILPSLEKIFDHLSDENSILQIDRLEIDLGIIKWDKEIHEIRIEYLLILLQKQTGELIRRISGEYYLRNNAGRELPVMKMAGPQSAGEQWIYYMNRGIIPWNVMDINDGWRMGVLEALATDYQLVSELKVLIGKNGPALERIVREHTITFLVTIAEVLSAHEQRVLPTVAMEMERILYPAQPNGISQVEKPVKEAQIIWQYLVKRFAAASGIITSIQIARMWIEEKLDIQELLPDRLSGLENELPLLGPVIAEILQNIHTKHRDDKKDQDEPTAKEKNKSIVEGSSNGEAENVIQIDVSKGKSAGPEAATGADELVNKFSSAKGEKEGQVRSADNAEILDEGIYIKYAGLVLLHPFFKFLFQHRGLISEGRFKDEASQEKAIYLLHYLATGTVQAEEYLLATAKLLCGWPLEEPLQSEARISPVDMMEADDLINAAIAQWTILKNTSADGVREGFLQRNGKVFMKNGDICFIIESHAIDLLLDHLPWNLSIIKLPWLKELIRVEWR